MRAMRNQESFQHPIVVDLTDDSRQNIGLQTITELFFLTAEHVKLISLEVVEAAGTTVNVLLLGQQSELVRQSIDAAATAHVLSLADLIRKKLVIKTRQAQPGDLEDEVIVELITDMLTQPTAKGEDVAAMLNSGMVPDRLRTQIQKHDLLTSMDHLLVDFAPAAADASPEKKQKQRELAESLSRYNDLMMSAWLHWIQGMANRVGGPAGMIVHNNDYNPVGGSKTNKKSGVHGGRGGPMREVVLPSFFTNPVEERLWTELYTKAKQKVDLREQGQELVGEENSPQLLTDEFAAELDKMLNKTRKAKMRKKEKLRSAASKSSRASSKKMQKDEQSSSISSRDDVESTDRKEAKPGRKEIVREDVDDEDKSSGDLLSDAMESTGTTRRVVNEGRSDGAPGSEESATELGETSRGGVHSAPSARTSTSRTTSSSTADVETGAASGMASEDEESSHSASDDDRLGGGEDESSKGIEMKQPLSAEQEALRDRVREVIEQVENESADLTESTELVVDFLLTEVPEDQQDFVLQVIRSEAPGESPEDVVVEVAGSAEGNENDLKKFIQALSGAPDEDEVDGAAEDHGKKGTEAEEAERDATGDWRMRRLLRRLAHDHEDEL
ncbi:unnamed protein product [Amoebophrya sp. A120]|nr:unnamed protein product [Amoebophrya sp. A120]|eukprot:GSA120T00003294001.1